MRHRAIALSIVALSAAATECEPRANQEGTDQVRPALAPALELGAELAFERQPWIPISGSGSSVYWNGTRYRVDWWDGSANVDKNGALRESTSTAGPIDAPRSRTAWSGTTAMSVDVLSDPRLIQVWG